MHRDEVALVFLKGLLHNLAPRAVVHRAREHHLPHGAVGVFDVVQSVARQQSVTVVRPRSGQQRGVRVGVHLDQVTRPHDNNARGARVVGVADHVHHPVLGLYPTLVCIRAFKTVLQKVCDVGHVQQQHALHDHYYPLDNVVHGLSAQSSQAG